MKKSLITLTVLAFTLTGYAAMPPLLRAEKQQVVAGAFQSTVDEIKRVLNGTPVAPVAKTPSQKKADQQAQKATQEYADLMVKTGQMTKAEAKAWVVRSAKEYADMNVAVDKMISDLNVELEKNAKLAAAAPSDPDAGMEHSSVVYPGPAYAKPEAMLAKIMKAGLPWRDCDAKSKYNIYGALTLHCFGDNEEQIYLQVFDNEGVGDDMAAIDEGQWHRFQFRGKNWAVSSTTPATADYAGKILIH